MNNYNFYSMFVFMVPLIYLIILGLFIYFIVKVIRFMDKKNQSDKELNNKIDKMLQMINKETK